MSEKYIVKNQKVTDEKVRMAREFRKNMTDAEQIFWSMVRKKRMFNLRFRRQQIIDGYIVDFYCNELKLIVEIDGSIHELVEQKAYDKKRSAVFLEKGLHVVRFSNHQVLHEKKFICETIRNLLSPSRRLGYKADGSLIT